MRADWRFKAAGFCGWLAVAVPAFVDLSTGRLAGAPAVGRIAAFVTFGAAYATYLRPAAVTGRLRRRSLVIIAILTVAGMTMVTTSVGLMKYLASVTLTVVAGELPYVLSRPAVWLWVAAQSVTLGLIFWASFGWVSGVSGGAAYAGFQVLALGRTWMELRERQARQQLARANAELRATRAVLAESSRVAERLRISRDLHDSVGHHLTALSLQLEVVARQLDGDVAHRIRECHAITRLLLADLRSMVGDLRGGSAIDLSTAIASLAADDAAPRIHVVVPDFLYVDTPAQANALLRCAQEVVTNAVRHATAQNVWIRVEQSEKGIEFRGSDDGEGATAVTPGAGLTGMRERFESHGGSLELTTAAGEGFALRAFMPRGRSPS